LHNNHFIELPFEATVEELFWGNDVTTLIEQINKERHLEPYSTPFDYILGADIVYEIQGFDALIKTLQLVTGPNTIICN
jgi:hypothetical protein